MLLIDTRVSSVEATSHSADAYPQVRDLSKEFTKRVLSIQPTGVRKMFDMAGDDIISFGLGEPDFQPPPIAIEEFHKAMLDGRNKYTTTAGLPELREMIAKSWSDYDSNLDQRNVCMTMSGTNALFNCFMALVESGDNVLIPEPYFPLYGPDVKLTGGEVRYYPCLFENEFIPTLDHLEGIVDENSKVIVYNFPSNPTGAMLTIEQRDVLLNFAKKHNLWIITDEVYDRIIYEGKHVSFLGTDYEKLLLINSFSKTFAMTGWRIGYVLSPNLSAMEQIVKLQYYLAACSNDGMQYAVLSAFKHASNYPDQMALEFKERRDLICERLNKMPGVSCHIPKGAFYVFPKVSIKGMNSEDLALELLKGGVLCSPGSAFGDSGEGHLRFAYTISKEDISRGMDKVEIVLNKLTS